MPKIAKDEVIPAIKSHAEHILGYTYAMGKSEFWPTKETAANIEQIAERIKELAASLR